MSLDETKVENNIPSGANKILIKTILLLLFILSFFTLHFAMFLVSIRTDNNSNSLAVTENMWLFFLPLPIPLASLILGLLYKKKGFKTRKNIVVGIIFAILLTIYGSFSFLFSPFYSHDYSIVNRVQDQINFTLPHKGNITTQDWSKGSQTGTDAQTTHYLYMSDVTFTDMDQIVKFNTDISRSEIWMTSVSTLLMGEVPSICSYLPSSNIYNYFMIYNTDLKTYNSIPQEPGTYRYIFIAYDSVHSTMKIVEYTLKILI